MDVSNHLRTTLVVALASSVGACGGHQSPSPPNVSVDGEPGSTVRVSVALVRVEAGGSLIVALFGDESGWLKEAVQERTVPADRETVDVAFEDVPAGVYAVAVVHDENGNGELDRQTFPFPKPTEGLAVSNNTWGFGAPDWGDAKFRLGVEPVRLRLELRYF